MTKTDVRRQHSEVRSSDVRPPTSDLFPSTPQRLFRAVLAGVIVSIIWTVTSYAAPKPPSRTELLQTLQHINQLAQDQQAALDQAKAAHAAVAAALGKATRDNVSLQAQVNAQTAKLNAVQDKLDKASKALWWYRLHWWGAWIALGLGILAWIVVIALKAAGKLTL